MASYDHPTAVGLVADLEAAQTALDTAVADGPEHYEPQGGALYAGSRPATQAAAMKAAVDAVAAYMDTLAPQLAPLC